MNRSFYLVAILLILAGCSDTGFKKLKSGLQYKIISGNGDKQIKYGSTVQFRAYGYYKDSSLATPYDTVAQFLDVDSMKLPPDYLKIFKLAKAGDSIVTRILVDTVLKGGGQLPPYAKKGQYLGFRFKILDVINDKSAAEAMRSNSMRQLLRVDSIVAANQKIKDDKILSDLVAKDKINAVKTNKGTYVEIQNPGEGMQVDSGKVVTVNYKGMTLDGKVFLIS